MSSVCVLTPLGRPRLTTMLPTTTESAQRFYETLLVPSDGSSWSVRMTHELGASPGARCGSLPRLCHILSQAKFSYVHITPYIELANFSLAFAKPSAPDWRRHCGSATNSFLVHFISTLLDLVAVVF